MSPESCYGAEFTDLSPDSPTEMLRTSFWMRSSFIGLPLFSPDSAIVIVLRGCREGGFVVEFVVEKVRDQYLKVGLCSLIRTLTHLWLARLANQISRCRSQDDIQEH